MTKHLRGLSVRESEEFLGRGRGCLGRRRDFWGKPKGSNHLLPPAQPPESHLKNEERILHYHHQRFRPT